MVDNQNPSMPDIPNAALKQKKSSSISVVWIIPIIAAVIGGWLVFQKATETKAVAEVTFESASGLEAGKTVVKLRNIKIGEVKDVKFSDDLASVIVVMEFEGVAQEQITDVTRFWVVRPRIGIGGVSGLDTLLSGAYIEVDPGDGGVPATHFTGLEEPEIYQLGNPGTKYVLRSNKLGSLARKSPVKFRGIQVGEVTRYKLADNHSHVDIEIFIESPHDKYVKPNTRFWNISGLRVVLDAEGVQIDMDSVVSLVDGGVAFSAEDNSDEQAPEATLFTLHKTEEIDAKEILTYRVPMKLYFDNGVKGLSTGAPVEFKGLRVGTVVEIGVEKSVEKKELLTYAIVDIEPERLTVEVEDDQTDAQRLKSGHEFIEFMVNKGMRAQLHNRNLLTGQSMITMDIFPSIEKGKVRYAEGVIIVPTAPETLAGLLEKVNTILQKVDTTMARLDAIPLETIGNNVEEVTASINSLVKSLNAAEGGMMGVQINEAIVELTRAAHAMRAMAEYLERHPEALLTGKSNE